MQHAAWFVRKFMSFKSKYLRSRSSLCSIVLCLARQPGPEYVRMEAEATTTTTSREKHELDSKRKRKPESQGRT